VLVDALDNGTIRRLHGSNTSSQEWMNGMGDIIRRMTQQDSGIHWDRAVAVEPAHFGILDGEIFEIPLSALCPVLDHAGFPDDDPDLFTFGQYLGETLPCCLYVPPSPQMPQRIRQRLPHVAVLAHELFLQRGGADRWRGLDGKKSKRG
jgi:hypothetical protein